MLDSAWGDSQVPIATALLVKRVTADLRDRILGFGPTRVDAVGMVKKSAVDDRCVFAVINRLGSIYGQLPRVPCWSFDGVQLGPRKCTNIAFPFPIPPLIVDDLAHSTGKSPRCDPVQSDFSDSSLSDKGLAPGFVVDIPGEAIQIDEPLLLGHDSGVIRVGNVNYAGEHHDRRCQHHCKCNVALVESSPEIRQLTTQVGQPLGDPRGSKPGNQRFPKSNVGSFSLDFEMSVSVLPGCD